MAIEFKKGSLSQALEGSNSRSPVRSKPLTSGLGKDSVGSSVIPTRNDGEFSGIIPHLFGGTDKDKPSKLETVPVAIFEAASNVVDGAKRAAAIMDNIVEGPKEKRKQK